MPLHAPHYNISTQQCSQSFPSSSQDLQGLQGAGTTRIQCPDHSLHHCFLNDFSLHDHDSSLTWLGASPGSSSSLAPCPEWLGQPFAPPLGFNYWIRCKLAICMLLLAPAWVYLVASRFRPGLARFTTALPALTALLTAPLLFDPAWEPLTVMAVAFSSERLPLTKVIAFCVGRGPLAPGPPALSLHQFLLLTLCPLALRTPPTSHTARSPQPDSTSTSLLQPCGQQQRPQVVTNGLMNDTVSAGDGTTGGDEQPLRAVKACNPPVSADCVDGRTDAVDGSADAVDGSTDAVDGSNNTAAVEQEQQQQGHELVGRSHTGATSDGHASLMKTGQQRYQPPQQQPQPFQKQQPQQQPQQPYQKQQPQQHQHQQHNQHHQSPATPPLFTRTSLALGICHKVAVLALILALLTHPPLYTFLNATHSQNTNTNNSNPRSSPPEDSSTYTSHQQQYDAARGGAWQGPWELAAVMLALGACVRRALLAVGMFCVMATFLELSLMSQLGAGLDLEAPFERPYLTTSLADFWGRRWNRPQAQLLRTLVFEPVRERRLVPDYVQQPSHRLGLHRSGSPSVATRTTQSGSSTVQPDGSTVQPGSSTVHHSSSTVQPGSSTVQPGSSTIAANGHVPGLSTDAADTVGTQPRGHQDLTAGKHDQETDDSAHSMCGTHRSSCNQGQGVEGTGAGSVQGGGSSQGVQGKGAQGVQGKGGSQSVQSGSSSGQMYVVAAMLATFLFSGVEHVLFYWYIRRAVYVPWGIFFPLHGLLAAGEQLCRRWLRAHAHGTHAQVPHARAHGDTMHGPHGAHHHQHAHAPSTVHSRAARTLSRLLHPPFVRQVLTLSVLHATACWGFYGALEDPVLVKRVRRALCATLPSHLTASGAASEASTSFGYKAIQQLCAAVAVGPCRSAQQSERVHAWGTGWWLGGRPGDL